MKYVGQNPDIRKILKDTRILLIPSEYESWGQVAIEAASCGIPVIASNATGLKESLGEAGIFCERGDTKSWIEAIKSLDDPKEYSKQSKKVLERAIELDPLKQLEEFNKFLEWVKNQQYVGY